MKKISFNKFFQLFKIGIPSFVLIRILATVLISILNPKTVSESVYNVSELENKIDTVKPGDFLNYNINGYSNWKILRKDEHNGTIDVVSETNVKDITFDYTNSLDALEILQNAADEYKNNSYAISARPISAEDAKLMAYDEEFWLSPKSDYVIESTIGDINVKKVSNGKVAILPYLEIRVPQSVYDEYVHQETNLPDENYIYNHTINDISEWVVIGRNNYGTTLYVIPKKAIEIEVNSVDDIIDEKAKEYFSTFSNAEEVVNIDYVGNHAYNSSEKYAEIVAQEETEKIHIVTAKSKFKHNNDFMWLDEGYIYSYNDSDNDKYGEKKIVYRNPDYYNKVKLGFRPVVTIKYGQGKEGKDIDNSKLKVGDYVKYSANGYNSWRVLSIDEDERTVEIISSGCVKNITINGKSGYNDAVELLQNEANQYIAGEKAISVRVIDENDSRNLDELDENSQNIGIYWTSEKKESTSIDDKNKYYMLGTYDGSYGSSTGYTLKINYIYLSIYDNIHRTEENFMYTAGLRPIIKLKLKDAEKIEPSECKKCEKTINIYNKLIIKEQQLKNEAYNKRFNGNAENEYTSSNENNNYYNNSYVNNTKNVTCKSNNCCNKDTTLLKIIVIIGIVGCILISILIVNSSLILRSINKNK